MKARRQSKASTPLVTGLLAGCLAFCATSVLPAVTQPLAPAQQPRSPPSAKTLAGMPARDLPARIPSRARDYYASVWGVDNFLVRSTASGHLIRFTYQVVNPARAEVLSDDRVTPHLVDPKRHLVLEVPSVEQVGLLRQKGKPVAGKEYWMVFSNKGEPVKVGDRVSVIIGSFRADGLRVE